MRSFLYHGIAASLAVLLIFPAVSAQVRLPQLISDGMVLQRDIPAHIWGWASPGERIVARFNGRRYRKKCRR